MKESLFLLLRLGLDTSSVSEEDCDKIKQMSVKEWNVLKNLAFKQSVGAIVFDGALKFCLEHKDIVFNQQEWKKNKLQWATNCMMIEDRNAKQIRILEELSVIWTLKGCNMLLMKGQANALYYPNPQHRSVGDIDCYLFQDYDKGNQIAESVGAKVDESWYKHSQIHYKGEMFENHQYFVHTREGKRSKRLENELRRYLVTESYEKYPGSDILLPPVMFNALFLTYHGLTHFLSEGIRMKQVVDWAMFLKNEQHHIDWSEFYRICKQFNLLRYLYIMNDIAVHYLGVKVNHPDIIADSPYTKKVIHSILYDDDYIFSSGEGSWRNRFHIISNLFKYRWKYHQIYQESIFRQLYFYVVGYLFHTDK